MASSASELTVSVEEGSSSILQLRGAGQNLDENAVLLSEKVVVKSHLLVPTK